jgi:hypothetical protein
LVAAGISNKRRERDERLEFFRASAILGVAATHPDLFDCDVQPGAIKCVREAHALAEGSLIPNDWQWSAWRDNISKKARSKVAVLGNSSVTRLIAIVRYHGAD